PGSLDATGIPRSFRRLRTARRAGCCWSAVRARGGESGSAREVHRRDHAGSPSELRTGGGDTPLGLAYAVIVSEQRAAPQPGWVRPALAGAVVVVALLTMMLQSCWCDGDRLLGRASLVALVVAVWIVELVRPMLPRLAFAALIAAPIGWLIFSDNGSVSGLFLLLMVGWGMYTGALRDGLIASGLAVLAILGYVRYDAPDRWLPWILGISATVLMMRMVVVQQQLVQQLRDAQADLARQAAAAERRRIAGEIHDVAAHSLAVTL